MDVCNLEQDMAQNLKDAGCANKQIQELLELYKQGQKEKVHKILEKHRKNVLDKVHKNERQIDCIDYFIYRMDKEK